MGSSMRVQPSCEYPSWAVTKNNGKMYICNLQKTPCKLLVHPKTNLVDDSLATTVRGEIDDFMYLLLQELNLLSEKLNRNNVDIDKKHLSKIEKQKK